MFSQSFWKRQKRRLLGAIATLALLLGITGCGSDAGELIDAAISIPNPLKPQPVAQITEVSPPATIQRLSQRLEKYQPQIAIAFPQPDRTLQETTFTLELDVRDFPIYQDPDLGLGPHLEVILDNEPYASIYDLSQPITFKDLNPGTHTLRVFATTPWGESFKNEGAYAQTTFHIFTPTEDRIPDANLPLLTYSNPIGTYGVQPILLDFYLTNAPLHLVAQENPDDDILDWRIRATVNGEELILDQWEPLYLQGFKPGNNWVKLEIVDELDNAIANTFNTTARLVVYDPEVADPLAKLIRGEIPIEVAQQIVDPNWDVPIELELDATDVEVEEDTEEVEPSEERIPTPVSETTPEEPGDLEVGETEEELETPEAEVPELEEVSDAELEIVEPEEELETPEAEVPELEEVSDTELEIVEPEEEIETPEAEVPELEEVSDTELEVVEAEDLQPENLEPEIPETTLETEALESEEVELPAELEFEEESQASDRQDIEPLPSSVLEQPMDGEIATPESELAEPTEEEEFSWREALTQTTDNLSQWTDIAKSRWEELKSQWQQLDIDLDINSLNPFAGEGSDRELDTESIPDVVEESPVSEEVEEAIESEPAVEILEELNPTAAEIESEPEPETEILSELNEIEEPVETMSAELSQVEEMPDPLLDTVPVDVPAIDGGELSVEVMTEELEETAISDL
ncbi:hypothetical protein [Roseofilum casamattae]|uniref:FHA domain containing protein n=1 Tax=Roseofilum casamattae BLCC-M143 TaxID=3022442 RepID=A0ABT7BQW5_9CYAN|nr:hypothetical protein [Roseofilum casamattae]MDJ1181584.1 hypothetical protein [Roseofilum casamattae BLCC-M143]